MMMDNKSKYKLGFSTVIRFFILPQLRSTPNDNGIKNQSFHILTIIFNQINQLLILQ